MSLSVRRGRSASGCRPLAWLRELVRIAGFPVVATSANISGEKEIDSGEAAVRQFADKVDLIVDGGKTAGGRPSTVVDLTSGKPVVRRDGAIPRAMIRSRLYLASRTINSTRFRLNSSGRSSIG